MNHKHLKEPSYLKFYLIFNINHSYSLFLTLTILTNCIMFIFSMLFFKVVNIIDTTLYMPSFPLLGRIHERKSGT